MNLSTKSEKELEFQDTYLARELFGPQERNLDLLRNKLGVEVNTRGTKLVLTSEDEKYLEVACNYLIQVYELLRAGHSLHQKDMDHALDLLKKNPRADLKSLFAESVFAVSPKKTLSPKTLGQREYIQFIRERELVFGIGPAGTGKTFLAVALAVSYLLQGSVKKIILTRPALEAGEKLGFLPGDIQEKINPYLRPLYDGLNEMLDFRKVQELLETETIEIAPLAFMRGRTLNSAFIILDEAQNTTPEQMKMFLTRIGEGSKAVVTGDITQIDLPGGSKSGLIHAREILANLDEIGFVEFQNQDVIRNELVAKIVRAYEEQEENK